MVRGRGFQVGGGGGGGGLDLDASRNQSLNAKNGRKDQTYFFNSIIQVRTKITLPYPLQVQTLLSMILPCHPTTFLGLILRYTMKGFWL